jgi:hypothetical protein
LKIKLIFDEIFLTVAMKELRAVVVSSTTHWASPYFTFFPAMNSVAAIATELIASAMNTIGLTRGRPPWPPPTLRRSRLTGSRSSSAYHQAS